MEKEEVTGKIMLVIVLIVAGIVFGLSIGSNVFPADGIKKVESLLEKLSTIERPDSLMAAAERASTSEIQAALYEKAGNIRAHRDSTITNVENVFKDAGCDVPLVIKEYIKNH